MHIELVAGIPNPSIPGHWLVPPWPVDSSISEVVRHFLSFHSHGDNAAHLLAYYQGYVAALTVASERDLSGPVMSQWCEELRDCAARCVVAYRDKLQCEAKNE